MENEGSVDKCKRESDSISHAFKFGAVLSEALI